MTTQSDWNGLIQAHVAPLYRRVSRRVGGDRELAEDVTQETWLRAVDAWKRKGAPRDPSAWLMTVAMNLLRTHFRRRPLESLGDASEEVPATPEGVQRERAARVQWGLAQLRTQQAHLLAAHHLDGESIAQLAQAHGLSERAVEGRLSRARAALRGLLGSDPLTTES